MSEKAVPALSWRDTRGEPPGVAHPQTDVVACYRDRIVSRVFATPPGMQGEQTPWTWTVTGPYLLPHMRLAATHEEGEAKILNVWTRWIAM